MEKRFDGPGDIAIIINEATGQVLVQKGLIWAEDYRTVMQSKSIEGIELTQNQLDWLAAKIDVVARYCD